MIHSLPVRDSERDARPPVGADRPAVVFRLSPELAVGAPPTPEQVRELRREGFAAIMDLRGIRASGRLNPMEEAALAADAGLDYVWRPMAEPKGGLYDLDPVISEVRRLAKPLFLHCADGRTAIVIGLMAARAMRDSGQLLARAAAMGLTTLDFELRQSVRDWFSTQGLERREPVNRFAD